MEQEQGATRGKEEKPLKFTVDLGVAYDDDLVKPKDFQEYLKTQMKVNGKKGNLGEDVTCTSSGKIVQVNSTRKVGKRYLKYLTKRFIHSSFLFNYF